MPEAQQQKTFVVSLKGIAPRIAQVRYEKDKSDLKLHFVLHEGSEIPSEAISLDIQGSKPAITPDPERRIREFLFNLLKSHENPQVRLLGVLLPKLEYIPRLETFIAQLTEADLASVKAKISALPGTVRDLKDAFSPQSSFLVLFESAHTCQGVLWSTTPQLRARFRNIAGGQEKGSWVLLSPVPLSSNQLHHAFLS
jgi:hypothetical protein